LLTVALEAVPVKLAVIVPAAKLPLPSRATIVLFVLLLVALLVTVNVAAVPPLYEALPDKPVPDTPSVSVSKLFPRVFPEIVDADSLVTAIAAEALISAFTIVPSAIMVLVTVPLSPVVTTVPVVLAGKVIVDVPAVAGACSVTVPEVEPINAYLLVVIVLLSGLYVNVDASTFNVPLPDVALVYGI
jgi:hypothetical protein